MFELSNYWYHVHTGELSAEEVQKARRLEVSHQIKIKVLDREPYSPIKAGTGKEPIEQVGRHAEERSASKTVGKRKLTWSE